MKRLLFVAQMLVSTLGYSQDQTSTQTIRGRILDKMSAYPLIGVFVEVQDLEGYSTVTDFDGYYRIENVPLGRHVLRVKYMGYEELTIPNVLVSSGKEVAVDLQLEEKILKTQEVVIDGNSGSPKVNNENATVSARSFSIEESSRYAGSRNDPARMAQSFAGVSTGDDSRNDIIIRGNSPLGVQYRMDGIVIPNPNHFGALGTTGGPVSILNNNVLSNSDFLTGAFPAEYGNALAGVFDLKMRSGNHHQHEFLGQVGLNGFEAGAEGPFGKSSRSSFLVNYRYSTLGVVNALGIDIGTTAVPQYQDLTFKLDFPMKEAGRLSIFGIGGTSYIELLGSELEENDLYGNSAEDTYFGSDMGVTGVNYLYFHNENTSSTFSLSASYTGQDVKVDSLTIDRQQNEVVDKTLEYGNRFQQVKYTVNYVFNQKINAKNRITSGIIADLYDFSMKDSTRYQNRYVPIINAQDQAFLVQAYGQWQHRLDEDWTLNSGLHVQHLFLNNSTALEPRLGLRYEIDARQTLNLGSGLHSQVQPFQVYFLEYDPNNLNNQNERSNEKLDFTRSAHLVLGYERKLSEKLSFKAETYGQYIWNVPVEEKSSSFSMLNAGADFGIPDVDSLVNRGEGTNIGLELTLEHTLTKGMYYLLTGTLYSSQYSGSDGVRRNTAFNGNYTLNALLGKEWPIGRQNAIQFDFKITAAGGRRYTPVDVEESLQEQETVYRWDEAYADQYPMYFRSDLRLAFRQNHKKVTQEFAVDIQNITNQENLFTRSYDPSTGEVVDNYQIGIFPMVQYRVTF